MLILPIHLTKEEQYRRVIREYLDTAAAITWLISEDARWITGKTLKGVKPHPNLYMLFNEAYLEG